MKSIKEKLEDLYTDKKVVLARGNTCLSCGRVKRESFEEGANYVLECFESILPFVAKKGIIYGKIKETIEQLKK